MKQTEEGNLMAYLSCAGKIIVATLNDRLNKIREEIMEELRWLWKQMFKKFFSCWMSGLTVKVVTLEVRVSKIKEKVDDPDTCDRQGTLVFSGEGIPSLKDNEKLSANLLRPTEG